ncbi:MAG: hypothetical protein K0Q94_1855 [Paenibacillus sp.]|jgi:hypothetical protein|uniref:hypothetical protein n=1 Tax=Paenibacillus sp. GCM10012303 TaxID=3317340 RepID=UPI0029ECFF57|nr:hypothetical protein [Paenibacillus sp.]
MEPLKLHKRQPSSKQERVVEYVKKNYTGLYNACKQWKAQEGAAAKTTAQP